MKTSEGGEFGLHWHIQFSPLLSLPFGNCLIYRCQAYEMPKVKYDNSKLGLIMNDLGEHSLSIFNNTYATIPWHKTPPHSNRLDLVMRLVDLNSANWNEFADIYT